MNHSFRAELPAEFVRNAVYLCGETGARWLDDLPRLVTEIETDWRLETKQPYANLSYNYVAPCVCANGGAAVLKIALPLDDSEFSGEANFLQTRNGDGAVNLLRFDARRRAMLLEQLAPGENLKQVCCRDDNRAVEIAVEVMRRLLKEPLPDYRFRLLDEWFDHFFEKAAVTKFPVELQNKTREIYQRLSRAANGKFLLHGDLHHENILSAERAEFLAIDPKGIVGDVGYEIAVFLNNHLRWQQSEPNLREKLDSAIEQFSQAFAVAPQDLRGWAFAQTILSAWWTFEDNGEGWQKELAAAEFWK